MKSNDADLNIVQQISLKNEIITPILNCYSSDGRLILYDFHLKEGHCQGLKAACEINSSNFQLTKVLLHKNQICSSDL